MAQMTDGPAAEPVVAIDIGNTRTKAGIVDVKQGRCLASCAFPTAELGRRLLCAIAAMPVSGGQPVFAVVAAVVGTAAVEACGILERNGYSVRRLTPSAAVPLTLRYTCPDMLGVDRLANAVYASINFTGRPVIIISAGTAIVVDYMAGNTYYGGAILPGVRLQFESLHHATDALPLIDVKEDVSVPSLPAGSTKTCITGGVLRGCAAAISGIVAGYAALNPAPALPAVICTGGDWELLCTLVDFKGTYLPDMTLIGTAQSLPYL
jgi:type III pantothenate kinase